MAKQKRYLHLDTERTDYSVTDDELTRLENASKNHWKDFCIVALALGIPCSINGFTDIDFDNFELTASIFLNCLFGTIGILSGIILGIVWYKTSSNFKTIIDAIKNKPKVDISDLDVESLVVNVGEIDDNDEEQEDGQE